MPRFDNYPDDIRQYDDDPRSPFYKEPPEEVDQDDDGDYRHDQAKDRQAEIRFAK